MILFVMLLVLWHWICCAVEMPVYTTWTLHTSPQPWSEAELICEMHGGYLANINSSDKESIFRKLLGMDPWKSVIEDGATVGLHNVNNQEDKPRLWLPDCLSAYSTFQYAYSYPKGGCVFMGASEAWQISCYTKNIFVCERPWAIRCPYQTLAGQNVSSRITFTTAFTSDHGACQTMCDQMGFQCWAAARDSASGNCYLYDGSSPFAFDNTATSIASDSNFTMFIKRCYEAVVDTDNYDWVVWDSNVLASTCASVSPEGKVYTLVKEKKAWNAAHAHCQKMGHQLAGSSVDEDRSTIMKEINHFYSTYYDASERDPHWVDFTGNASVIPTWGDSGKAVSGLVTVTAGNYSHCGLLELADGSRFLQDCSELYSFLCVKKGVPCVSKTLAEVIGPEENFAGYISLDKCRAECIKRLLADQPCEGFTQGGGLLGLGDKCYLHTSATTFFPPYTKKSTFNLVRISCAWAVLQEDEMAADRTTQTPISTSVSTQTASTESETTELRTVAEVTTTEMTTLEAKSTQTTWEETTSLELVTTSATTEPTTILTTIKSPITLPMSKPRHAYGLCACRCLASSVAPVVNYTEVQEIIQEMIIPRNDTTKSKRKLSSAPDDRASAQSLGLIIVSFVGAILTVLIIWDLPTMLRYLLRKEK